MQDDSDGPNPTPTLSPTKRAVFITLALIVGVGVMEGVSAILLHIAPSVTGLDTRTTREIYAEQSEWLAILSDPSFSGREVVDPALGWRYRPGFDDGSDRVTSQGLRGSRVYAPRPDSGVLRVAAFGDSFVYGSDVDHHQSWPAILERRASGLEVLNYGVGGYGSDQAYLRFLEEGMELNPDLVLVGFAPVNLRRAVNRYRRFVSSREFPLFKPRFRVDESGDLTLIPSPLAGEVSTEELVQKPRLALAAAEHDQWYRPAVYENPLYDWSATVRLLSILGARAWERFLDPDRVLVDGRFNPASEAFAVQVALLEAFYDDACGPETPAVVLILPDRDSIEDARRDRPTIYDPLLDSLDARGIPVLDGIEAFRGTPPESGVGGWFGPRGHYSPVGNAAFAKWLKDVLADGSPVPTCPG